MYAMHTPMFRAKTATVPPLVVDVGSDGRTPERGAGYTNVSLAARVTGESQAALAKVALDLRARVRFQTGHDTRGGW